MTIVDVLEQNSRSYGDEICLVEINPEVKEVRRVTWKEYELMEPNPLTHYRREISWGVFDEKANRFANLLLERGIKKGDKVAILLMNCLEYTISFYCIAVFLSGQEEITDPTKVSIIFQLTSCHSAGA